MEKLSWIEEKLETRERIRERKENYFPIGMAGNLGLLRLLKND